jgi:hypothetical protein
VSEEWPAGFVFEVPHPFCWEEVSLPPHDPEADALRMEWTWRPGVRPGALVPPDGGDEPEEADGMGCQILTIVSIHRPGRYPSRVFYTRRWRDPAGKEFGKGALRIKTMNAFKRLIAGYRHEFRLIEREREAA